MLQEGQEILEGRFKIIKKLGSGAFGEIFKGNSHSCNLNESYSRKEKDWGVLCRQNCKNNLLLYDPTQLAKLGLTNAFCRFVNNTPFIKNTYP
jgi:hypothetical protein